MSLPFPTRILSCAIVLALSSINSFAVESQSTLAPLPNKHIEYGAAHFDSNSQASSARKPATPQALPPSLEQIQYDLPPSNKPRTDLTPVSNDSARMRSKQAAPSLAATPACEDMNKLASYQGEALGRLFAGATKLRMPLWLVFHSIAAKLKWCNSASNVDAVARRFVSEAAQYNASNIKLVNLLIYLRAGYYLASGKVISQPAASVVATLRPAIRSF